MDFQYLLKLAASYDARRKKQYWQLLKRMYGGTDRAVKRLRETRDPNIYHGTRAKNIPSILAQGLRAGEGSSFGKGVYFGTEPTTEMYARDFLVDKSGKRLWEDIPKDLKNLPKGVSIDKGTRIRLKRPSELKGTKILYPNVQNAMVFDVSAEKPLHTMGHVGFARQPITELMVHREHTAPARLAKQIKRRMADLSKDEVAKIEIEALKRRGLSPDELKRAIEEVNKIKDHPIYDPSVVARYLAEEAVTPKDPKKLNKLKYYGTRGRKRVFEEAGNPVEQILIKQDIDPNLLHIPGSSLSQSIQKHKGLSRNAKIGLGVGLGAAAIGTGIALHKRRRKQREGLQKVAYLKELEQWEKRNFRDDRGTIKDMIEQSVENLGEQNRERIVNALRRQYQALGEVGLKQPFQTEEDLKGFENAKWNKEEFMKTKMYAPHPLFGYKYKFQPRSIYNKWHYDGDGRALFEGQPLKVPAKGLRRLVRKHQVLKPGTKKHERALDDLARRLADEKVVFLNPITGAPITFDKYRTQSKQ